MAKNTKTIAVSIDAEQADFLDSLNLSPSELMREKIEEHKRIFNATNQEKERLLQNLKGLQEEIGVLHTFIDELGKFDIFRKWRGEYVVSKKQGETVPN